MTFTVKSPDRHTKPPQATHRMENQMTTKTNSVQPSGRIETVLNSLLVAAMVGAVAWAAIAPSLAPVLTRA